MRSLAHRIVSGCKPRYRTCLLCVGPCVGALAGHLEPSIHAHAYTRDIRNFVLTRLWATILDLQVYRDVWPEGVEWAESSSCNQERETGQKLPCGPQSWVIGSLWPHKSARSSGLTPHKRPLGQHSKFCVRQFEFITLCVRWMVNSARSGAD